MSVGKPFSESYGALEALRPLTAVWNVAAGAAGGRA
jgi:hypothetical protein